jgi:hypothetical protein
MSMSGAVLVPVGVDCDCGHPMVWRNGKYRQCAVSGTHNADDAGKDLLVIRRNYNAPLANVVDELDQMTYPNVSPRNQLRRARGTA